MQSQNQHGRFIDICTITIWPDRKPRGVSVESSETYAVTLRLVVQMLGLPPFGSRLRIYRALRMYD
jgi:hypothetical protein